MSKETIPFDALPTTALASTVSVAVVDGVDAGAHAEADRLTVGTAKTNDLVLTDETVSRFHAELEVVEDGVLVTDNGSRNGTFVGDVRVHKVVVRPGSVLRIGSTTLEIGGGAEQRVSIHATNQLGDLHGASPLMRRLFKQIERAAQSEASVLIVGESGTGKELIARALHQRSGRRGGPFVTVDCGAIAHDLVPSELFGHEKGAFTGADRRHVGAFERAHGGTLFLDEIGELASTLQPTLLGALERRRFRRVGGKTEIETDVRVVAATNRDLRSEVNDGSFRLDLYYRIAVVTLRVAPLRERPEDIDVLIDLFLRESGQSDAADALFPTSLRDTLRKHRWPGNVRELRNLVEATVAMGQPQLHDEIPGPKRAIPVERQYKEARALVLAEFEREYLKHWLKKTGGNVAKAAREAGMDRSHLTTLLQRHGLR